MPFIQVLASDDTSGGAVAWLVVVACVAAALVVLFGTALVSVLRSPGLTTGARAAWVVGVLVFPLVGPVAWFLIGRSGARPVRSRAGFPRG